LFSIPTTRSLPLSVYNSLFSPFLPRYSIPIPFSFNNSFRAFLQYIQFSALLFLFFIWSFFT